MIANLYIITSGLCLCVCLGKQYKKEFVSFVSCRCRESVPAARGSTPRARATHTRGGGVSPGVVYLYTIFCHLTSFELVKTLYLLLSALLSLLLLPASCNFGGFAFLVCVRAHCVVFCALTLCVLCSALSLLVTPRVRFTTQNAPHAHRRLQTRRPLQHTPTHDTYAAHSRAARRLIVVRRSSFWCCSATLSPPPAPGAAASDSCAGCSAPTP